MQRIRLLLALTTLLGLQALVSAQTCSTKVEFRFKKSTANPNGQRSFIEEERTAITVAVKKPLPPIIIQGLNADRQLDWRLNGKTVSAVIEPPLRVAGTTVEFNQGEAIFSALTLQEGPSTTADHYLHFYCQDLTGDVTKLSTAKINIKEGAAIQTSEQTVKSLVFGSYGYFRDKVTPVPVITQEDVKFNRQFPVPPFWLEIVNELGYPLSDSAFNGKQFEITVVATGTHTDANTKPLNEPTEVCVLPTNLCTPDKIGASAKFTVTKARNKMADLHVYAPPESSSGPTDPVNPQPTAIVNGRDPKEYGVQIEFGLSIDSVPPVGVATLIAQRRSTKQELQRNTFMLFDTSSAVSHFTFDNIGNTAVMGVPLPPVVLRFFTSKLAPDVSNTGLVIQATSTQGELIGGEALVVQGVATFRDLAFTGSVAPRSAVINFIAVQQNGEGGQELSSGPVSVAVTAIKAKHLSFARSSFTQANVPRTVQINNGKFILQDLVIQMKDSAYQIDSTANDIELLVKTSSSSGNNLPLTVKSGIAALRNQEFSYGNQPTFTLRVTDAKGIRGELISAEFTAITDTVTQTSPGDSVIPVSGASKVGCVTVTDKCYFKLAFGHPALSLIYEEDQDIFATHLTELPEVIVRLDNIFNNPSLTAPASKPILKVFTGTDPGSEAYLKKGANMVATDSGWEYKFNAIIFNKKPTGLVRLQFQLFDSSGNAIAGIPSIRSGFVSVASSRTSNYGLRFAKTNQAPSLITYARQTTSAVVNIALPPIVIEVVDSQWSLDEATNDVYIVASVEGGSLHADGATERTVKGRATFSTLRFSSVVDEPVITFRARQSTYAVSGKEIQTGHVTLTRLPIPFYNIAFATGTVPAANEPTREYWTSKLGASIKTKIYVIDSAHQVELSVPDVSIDKETNSNPSNNPVAMGAAGCASCVEFVTSTLSSSTDFFTFKAYVPTTSDKSLLNGRTLTIGPITNPVEASSTTGVTLPPGTFDAATDLPGVVRAKFKRDLASFTAGTNQKDTLASIARMMGIAPDRVVILTNTEPVATSGVDPATLARWTGTKVTLEFKDPTSDSTNRKSAKTLADEFLGLRPGCDAQELALAAVFKPAQDGDCDPAAYDARVKERAFCVGTYDTCACYNPEAPEGTDKEEINAFLVENSKCWQEPQYQQDIKDLCNRLIPCTVTTELDTICAQALQAKSVSLAWIAAPICGGVLLGVALFASWYKGLLCFKKTVKPQLNKNER